MESTPPIRLALIHAIKAERAAWASRLHQATVAQFDDFQQFTDRTGTFDLVLLGASHDPKIVHSLLASKLNVFLVADRVPSVSVLESLYATAHAGGVQLLVVNPDCFLPSRQLIRRQVGSTLGEAGLIRSHRWLPGLTESEFSDRLVRDVDSILWLAGRLPDRVFALESKEAGSLGRYVQVHLGFPGGGMALLDLTSRLPAGDEYASLSVIAASGAAYADDHHNMQLVYRGDRPQGLRTDERTRQYAAMAQEAIDAISSKRDCSAGLTEWNNVWNVADAVGRSIASGQAIALGGE